MTMTQTRNAGWQQRPTMATSTATATMTMGITRMAKTTRRGTRTAPAWHPGDTAPPTTAAGHACGAERGAMERGQWDYYKMMALNDEGQIGSKHPHHNSTGWGWGWGWGQPPPPGRGGVLVLSSRFCILVVWKTHPRCLITCWKVFCKWMKIYLKNGRNSTSQNVLKRPLKVD